MRDPQEGVGPDGTIVTGVGTRPIGAAYEAVLAASAEEVTARLGDALHGLYVYGSVATGQARPPRSDLDLYAVTRWPAAAACREAADALSAAFVDTVREVGIASTPRDEVMADGSAGEAERCFLRHYCAHVAGEDLRADLPGCRASLSLARAFNGDIGEVVDRTSERLQEGPASPERRRLVATGSRRLLMAAATLLSARQGGWTTDRTRGAELLTAAAPELAVEVERVRDWTDVDASGRTLPPLDEVVATFAVLRAWLVQAYGEATGGDRAARHYRGGPAHPPTREAPRREPFRPLRPPGHAALRRGRRGQHLADRLAPVRAVGTHR